MAAPMRTGMAAGTFAAVMGVVAFGDVRREQTAAAIQNAQLIRLAIELGTDRPATAIPLDPERPDQFGLMYDRFIRAHVNARAAALAGKSLNPLKPPRDLLGAQLLIVGLPLTCGERTVRPTDVDVLQKTEPVSKWFPVKGTGLQKLLPGVSLPANAIGVLFDRASIAAGEMVQVTYGQNVCSGETKRMEWPVNASRPRILDRPLIEMPAGLPPLTGPVDVAFSGVLDLDGRLRYAASPDATPFGTAALEAARNMRFEPARINGTPTPWTAGVTVTFGPG